MLYSIASICCITKGQLLNASAFDLSVSNIVFDTRKISFQKESIFIALKGNTDGHQYVGDAYEKGIRNFLVSSKVETTAYPQANFIHCKNTLAALQTWARHHRSMLKASVIAITGSNGKTIVKEWLAQALEKKYQLGKSPQSFNSQLGVALSVLNIPAGSELAIIEAGISEQGEMSVLEPMIKPHIGILTNIGDAHSRGFSDKTQKLEEKLKLFSETQIIIYNSDQEFVHTHLSKNHELKTITWGNNQDADIRVTKINQIQNETSVQIEHGVEKFLFALPLKGEQMYENVMHVISYLILDNWSEAEIQEAIDELSTLSNRMEIKQGINNCILINDSYSADLASTQIAIEQLDSLANGKEKILIISAFDHQRDATATYSVLAKLIDEKNISEVIAIGMAPESFQVKSKTEYHNSTSDFISTLQPSRFQNSAILIKGARKYQLENISDLLSKQVHQTKLETNLSAITHNLNVYKSRLRAETKIMAVVKAEAYGSGSSQMVSFLENQKVDYLAVALIDEAVQLRKNGCKLPIMIFNIQEGNLNQLWEYGLEPEVYNFSILEKLSSAAKNTDQKIKIHLKIDSGMHRLGFLPSEINALGSKLQSTRHLEVVSIFSHLASSEKEIDDAFTRDQIDSFQSAYNILTTTLAIEPMKHLLNTTGIIRFPEAQYDMVRLGLGLYGIDESQTISNELSKAHTLTARVLQIKALATDETTGYNRSGSSQTSTDIAVISVGYADGILRACGRGNHHFTINDQSYPTIGNICMDVSMLNLGLDHNVKVGDEVIIFGPNNSIESLAKSCNTITYEVISRIAPRVKRTYIYT